MKTSSVLISLFTICALSSCVIFSQVDTEKEIVIGFYNVENLFDTEDDPKTADDEFTPTGRLLWDNERYQAKLGVLSRVISEMGLPTLMGLAEVENEKVVRDLAMQLVLTPADYGVVHFDSPDGRGIDVALMYRKSDFRVINSSFIRIEMPGQFILNERDSTTRDVLYAEGMMGKKDRLHVFVIHWPSRVGGEKETEPKRIFVAQQIRKKLDEIFAKDQQAKVVIMGDFNDETDNISVASALGAFPMESTRKPATMYNLFSGLDASGKGTYNFRGNWNMLDHIIVSSALLAPAKGLHFSRPEIFERDWMMYEDKTYGKTPNRTYGGGRYFGGVSDHLPVLIR